MARSTTTRAGAGLTAVLLLGGVSACGGSSDEAETAQQSQQPATALEPGDDVEPTALVQRLSSPGKQTLSSFTFTADAAAEDQQVTIAGGVDLDGESPTAELTMELPPLGSVDLLLVDDVGYVDIPNLTPPGKYVQVPADELAEVGMSDVTESLDIQELMQKWESSGAAITYVGEDEVDGEATEHFELVVDPQQILDEAGQTASPDLEVEGDLTYGVWVGQDDLVRKMQLDIDGADATVRMDDWGQELQVQAPKQGDIVQMPSFG
ncbi:MAG TPA: hypothetical protein VJ976_12030 [Ornithinimicrobium sp.]|uniref:hypothetical protein n=1 Tax=Ornithinimicrobium sp. TaxID=1977084 RepID=UPI002B47E0A5|nr:hypothetical protein [Ornithinimicrobium sp.]HKJ13102.1 hypothetical protein [Ornithinimicrobium sp.]